MPVKTTIENYMNSDLMKDGLGDSIKSTAKLFFVPVEFIIDSVRFAMNRILKK